MRHLASFRKFLSTGALGPVDPNCSLLATAQLLGPPQEWITEHDVGYPLYWQYEDPAGGPLLEMRFGIDPPHQMHWFQIEHAGLMRGDVHLFGSRLALAMDGFHGANKASELIGSGVWDTKPIGVCFDPHDLTLTITAGKIVVLFSAAVEAERIESGLPGDLFEAFGSDERFLEFERLCEIDSIYSHAEEQGSNARGSGAKRCSGGQYLASLSTRN